jgi:hypothetical protein
VKSIIIALIALCVGCATAVDEPIDNLSEGDAQERENDQIAVAVEPTAADHYRLIGCLSLAKANIKAKEEFCRSLPDEGMRARCWKYRWNAAEWTGWCFYEFGV